MSYQAAIFDMDGLLLDTERVALHAFQQACDRLSLPFLKPVYLNIIGQNAKGIEETILAGYGCDLDYFTLRSVWMEYYHGVVEHQAIPIKEGVINLLEWLTAQQIPMTVATSSAQRSANIKLQLSGLNKYFDRITTGCEVSQGKPHPEIFLLAAERLNTAPQHCLGFEDSNNGVRAGVAAGLQMFQIPDLVTPDSDIIALGHTITPSLSNVLLQLRSA